MVQRWIRQALGAAGVAVLVPVAIVAAIALSVVGGGNARSLSQVLTGPAVPPAEASQPPAGHARRATGGTVPTVARRAAAAPRRSPADGVAPPRRRPVMTRPLPPHRPSPAHPGAPPSSPPAPSQGGSPAPPPPAPRPIHDTGTQVAETIRPLPVAGPVAADTVQAGVDLVDPPA